VDPVLVPANAPVGPDVAPLDAVGVCKRSPAVGHLPG
jgi:hypothetical protein